jgi:hypothetical protein
MTFNQNILHWGMFCLIRRTRRKQQPRESIYRMRTFLRHGQAGRRSRPSDRFPNTAISIQTATSRTQASPLMTLLKLSCSYTWSKTLTDADSIQPYYSTVLGQGGTQNPYDLKAEKAVSTQDVPNNFVVSYLYDLPFGHGRKYLSHTPKVVDEAIGGWRVGGIQRYLSGQPISFFGAGGIPGFDNGIRYDLVPGINPVQIPNYGHSNPFNYAGPASAGSVFNKSAFMDPNANRGTGPFQFGTMPRNSANIRTPTYFDEDFNISKTFPIHDQVNAEFRVEAFDAFNRHVFSKPDSGVQDTNFGQITGLINGPRNLQLVLKIHY